METSHAASVLLDLNILNSSGYCAPEMYLPSHGSHASERSVRDVIAMSPTLAVPSESLPSASLTVGSSGLVVAFGQSLAAVASDRRFALLRGVP